jgi:DNA modification methylase
VYESDLALDKHPVIPSVVFDPFGGSGTTAGVAIKNNRRAILCELNEDYVEMMGDRIAKIAKGWRKGQKSLEDFM